MVIVQTGGVLVVCLLVLYNMRVLSPSVVSCEGDLMWPRWWQCLSCRISVIRVGSKLSGDAYRSTWQAHLAHTILLPTGEFSVTARRRRVKVELDNNSLSTKVATTTADRRPPTWGRWLSSFCFLCWCRRNAIKYWMLKFCWIAILSFLFLSFFL